MANTSNQGKYDIWNEFLETWPVARVNSMTLAEYNQVGDKDTFCAWVESRTDTLGSIWGGSAYKFGIYHRKDKVKKISDTRYAQSEDYAWDRMPGETEGVAFEAVRGNILQTIEAVQSGDLSPIDKIKFWPVYKWKIASLYQSKDKPLLPCVFKEKWLRAYLGENGSTVPISALHKAVMQKFDGSDLLGFSEKIWTEAQLILDSSKVAEAFTERQYWLYAPGEKSSRWEQFYNEGVMAIGWDDLGDLSLLGDKEAISDHLREVYSATGSAKNDVLANYQFRDSVAIGDAIICKKGRTEYVGYGLVTGEYNFDHTREDFKHCRKVDWKKKGIWTDPRGDIVLKTLTNISEYPDCVFLQTWTPIFA